MSDDADRQKEELGGRFDSLTGEKDDAADARDTPDAPDTDDANDSGQSKGAADARDTPDAPDTDDANDSRQSKGATDTRDTGDTPVREQQRKTLYLPEGLVDDLELTFDALNLRWRQAGNDPLEKHPDFYEQLLRNALEDLGDVQERDVEAIAEELGLEE